MADSTSVSSLTDLPVPITGFLAPEFELMTLTGDRISLTGLKGKPVIVNFWASWCQPCRTEMPAIQRAFDKHQGDGLVVLAVNVTNQDQIGEVQTFVQELGLTFPILLDTKGEAQAAYRISALPTTYFIRQDGVIEEVVIGGPMAEALLMTRLEKLFKER